MDNVFNSLADWRVAAQSWKVFDFICAANGSVYNRCGLAPELLELQSVTFQSVRAPASFEDHPEVIIRQIVVSRLSTLPPYDFFAANIRCPRVSRFLTPGLRLHSPCLRLRIFRA